MHVHIITKMTSKNIKSMQEIMLEFIVMNYKEVFSLLWRGSISRKKVLPPSLFQKICYKSQEMKWCIHNFYMEKLLTSRDILSWKDIDVVLYYDHCKGNILNSDVLKVMSGIEYPIKNLSIYVDKMSDERASALCTMGSTIECLDLRYYDRTCRTELLKGSFPHLRKLSLTRVHAGMYEGYGKLYIDLRRFSDTLEELKLENEYLDDRLIGSIASLKKLKVLSLPFSKADYLYFYESLRALNHLRTLDIRHFIKSKTYSPKLLSVICQMPNLENLDVTPSIIMEKHILESVKCRKWKKFGFYINSEPKITYFNTVLNNYQPSYYKFKSLADQIFGSFNETMLSTFEIYAQGAFSDVKSIVLTFLPFIQQEQIAIVEKIILNTFAGSVYSPYRREVLEYIKTGRCTDDFITKIINIITSYYHNYLTLGKTLSYDEEIIGNIITSAPVARKMLEIVENDLNKGLCRKLLEMLFICSYYNLPRDIDALGLRKVCDKAHENKFLDDDAVMAMKTLLKQIKRDLIYVPQNWSSVIR